MFSNRKRIESSLLAIAFYFTDRFFDNFSLNPKLPSLMEHRYLLTCEYGIRSGNSTWFQAAVYIWRLKLGLFRMRAVWKLR